MGTDFSALTRMRETLPLASVLNNGRGAVFENIVMKILSAWKMQMDSILRSAVYYD